MNHCVTCKHWQLPDPVAHHIGENPLSVLHGQITYEIVRQELQPGECSKLTEAIELDGDGTFTTGRLGTLPYFGCSGWEEK